MKTDWPNAALPNASIGVILPLSIVLSSVDVYFFDSRIRIKVCSILIDLTQMSELARVNIRRGQFFAVARWMCYWRSMLFCGAWSYVVSLIWISFGHAECPTG